MERSTLLQMVWSVNALALQHCLFKRHSASLGIGVASDLDI